METKEPERDSEKRQARSQWRSFSLVLAGMVLYWLALPPVGAWPLGWIVAVPWTIAIFGSEESQPGWRRVWLAGWIFWLATLHFIPYPHPALWIAWPLLAGYLAFYPVAFYSISRRLVSRLQLPAVVVLPLVWATLEWIRNWMITGFGMASLAHSQYRQPSIIQIASFGGEGLVSLCMMIVGVTIGLVLTRDRRKELRLAIPVSILSVAAIIWSGLTGLNNTTVQLDVDKQNSTPVVLVQGSIDTVFFGSGEAEKQREWQLGQRNQYRRLSLEARRRWPEAELLIWPEGIFGEWLVLDEVPDDFANQQLANAIEQSQLYLQKEWGRVTGFYPEDNEYAAPEKTPIALLTGVPGIRLQEQEQFNSAMLVDENGAVSHSYNKNHRVIFGEYIPLAKEIPWLGSMSPIGSGIGRGLHAEAFQFKNFVLMPEICFETTVPHHVRRHWRELDAQGTPPDCLLCLTNDGWFYGTSCLDLHLACNVFRAVETGTPMLVAANTGFSADIDAAGRILQQGPRRSTGSILAWLKSRPAGRTGCIAVGDWHWRIFSLLILAGLLLSRRAAQK